MKKISHVLGVKGPSILKSTLLQSGFPYTPATLTLGFAALHRCNS